MCDIGQLYMHVHMLLLFNTLCLLQLLALYSLRNHIRLYCPNATHPSGTKLYHVISFIKYCYCMINIMCIDLPISAPLYYVGECHSSDVCDVEPVQVLS